MKGKCISVALAGIMLFSGAALTACGGGGKSDEVVYVHSWTQEGLGGHFYSGADMGPVSWYVVEGFGDFLRTQDYVFLTTAESITHDGDVSTVALRPDVTWQGTNEKFTAMDVVSFYYLNNTTAITKYVTKIEA